MIPLHLFAVQEEPIMRAITVHDLTRKYLRVKVNGQRIKRTIPEWVANAAYGCWLLCHYDFCALTWEDQKVILNAAWNAYPAQPETTEIEAAKALKQLFEGEQKSHLLKIDARDLPLLEDGPKVKAFPTV